MSNEPRSVPNDPTGNVTISTTIWDQMRDRAKDADREIVDLKKALAAAVESADVTGTITRLNRLVRETFTVVRFAVSNLPPETIRRWPSEALRMIAGMIPLLPDHTVDDDSFANELRVFAGEIELIERERALRGAVKPMDYSR